MLDEIFDEKIKSAVSLAFDKLAQTFDALPNVPPIATTSEMANALRVSDEVLRRMAEDGMPHTHAGRELRFGKSLVVEWMTSGKIYACDICANKSKKEIPEQDNNSPTNVFTLSSKTSKKLAEIAGAK